MLLAFACAIAGSGCRRIESSLNVRPRALRDVPAERLAFRFEPDVSTSGIPASFLDESPEQLHTSVKVDFETRRREERLLRTVVSPDGQRVLALYETIDTAEGDFRLDLYSADGTFIRNILPPELSGTFPASVAWSPDGQQITFIGIKNSAAQPTATPFDPIGPPKDAQTAPTPSPEASPTVMPNITSVPAFSTEQIYLGDRDGYGLHPLTTREGLIYFQIVWSPDARSIAALACKESEWNARREENKAPAGRPRIISLDGRERLLSDDLAESAPVWSPDSSKIATSFGTDVAIYDANSESLTAGSIQLHELLISASIAYDARLPQKSEEAKGDEKKNGKSVNESASDSGTTQQASSGNATPLSFNPIVRLAWVQPETLFIETAFLRVYKDEPVKNYPRWHVLHLSPQAAVLACGIDRYEFLFDGSALRRHYLTMEDSKYL